MNRTRITALFNPNSKTPNALKTHQEYRWSCSICHGINHAKFNKKFTILESKRHGTTTAMKYHLIKAHQISRETHEGRISGYNRGHGNEEYSESGWSGTTKKQQNRLTAREATRRWFVKTRQPFSAVESVEFQEMFRAYNIQCAYKSRHTLRNHVFADFQIRRQALIDELKVNCVSISFTLDMWTSPNRKPIFAIIGHWLNDQFQEREEVLEFIQVKGLHTGEALAKIVITLIYKLGIVQKLYAITGDNAGNNGQFTL